MPDQFGNPTPQELLAQIQAQRDASSPIGRGDPRQRASSNFNQLVGAATEQFRPEVLQAKQREGAAKTALAAATEEIKDQGINDPLKKSEIMLRKQLELVGAVDPAAADVLRERLVLNQQRQLQAEAQRSALNAKPQAKDEIVRLQTERDRLMALQQGPTTAEAKEAIQQKIDELTSRIKATGLKLGATEQDLQRLGETATNDSEKEVVTTSVIRGQLQDAVDTIEIGSTYRTPQAAFNAVKLQMKERAFGRDKLTDSEKEYVEAYTDARGAATEAIAGFRKSLLGTAVTPTESKALETMLPTPGDTPSVQISKLNSINDYLGIDVETRLQFLEAGFTDGNEILQYHRQQKNLLDAGEELNNAGVKPAASAEERLQQTLDRLDELEKKSTGQ